MLTLASLTIIKQKAQPMNAQNPQSHTISSSQSRREFLKASGYYAQASRMWVVCPAGADELASAPGLAGATAISLAEAKAKQPRCVKLLRNGQLLDAAIIPAGRQ